MSLLKIEKIKCTMRDCSDKFFYKWHQFIYFKDLQVLPSEHVPTTSDDIEITRHAW